MNGRFAGTGPTRTTVQAGAIIFGCKVELSVTARRAPGAPPLPPEGPLPLPTHAAPAAISADRMRGALWGMFIGDALAVPAHWYYNRDELLADYGTITG